MMYTVTKLSHKQESLQHSEPYSFGWAEQEEEKEKELTLECSVTNISILCKCFFFLSA